MKLKADLHIHSCLSPCGSLDMSPSRIVTEALKKKLDLISIADHNTARNLPTLDKLCKNTGLQCLYGMEITSAEEVHLLVYFTNLTQALEFDSWIYQHLPNIPNNPELFGDQVVVDEKENIIEEIPKYLGNATTLDLPTLIQTTHAQDGFCVPAHITHPHFSLISQLGWIPDDDYDALELSTYYFMNRPDIQLPTNYPFITGSDAHYPEDIGRNFTEFSIISPSQTPPLPWQNKPTLFVQEKHVQA